MDVIDLSWNESTLKRFNHPLLPNSIRGLIVGKSGCGKTTLLLNLLLRPGLARLQRAVRFWKKSFSARISHT